MPLVTVKPKYQVTIPTSVRKQAGVGVGDAISSMPRWRGAESP